MNGWLASILVASFARPRQAAREMLRMPFSSVDIFGMAAVVAIAVTLLNWVVGQVFAVQDDPVQQFIKNQPMLSALVQLAAMPIGATISIGIARLFGGKGSFRDTMVIFVWLNALMAVVQAVLLVFAPILSFVGTPLVLAALVWSLIAYANGLAEVHGFKNVYLVIAVMLGLSVLLLLLMSYMATQLGLVPAGAF